MSDLSYIPTTSNSSSDSIFFKVANVALLPAAGALGLVVQPARGLLASVKGKTSLNKQRERLEARLQEGREAVSQSSASERTSILAEFDRADGMKKERKERLTQSAVVALAQPEVIPVEERNADTEESRDEEIR